jgi:GTP cyclohydrolase II
MRSLTALPSTISPFFLVALLGSAVGVGVVSIRAFVSEETKARRLELKRQKELRVLAERISAYARRVHKQFPTGDVVVSERDLAEQLRKRTDMVVTALNLLLNEQKVQRAPLSGYWKLDQ